MKSYLNITGKYLDASGRKPPSRHYQIDETSKKIYSTLYPEPGFTNKVQNNKINIINNLPHTINVPASQGSPMTN